MAALGKGFADWLTRLRKPKKPVSSQWTQQKQSIPSIAPSTSELIGRHHFVFGLDWQLYTDSKDMRRVFRMAYDQGYTHRVVSASGDMIGLAAGLNKNLGKPALSTAVHLSETASLGGLELFIFELPDALYSLTALNDSLPIPNFDQVGTQQEVVALVTEYRALQSNQLIRFVGNTELFEGMEKMSLNEAFSRPDTSAALQPLPNYKFRKLLLTILLPSVLAFAGLASWLEHQRQVEEQERIAREQDPNYIYENAVGAAMQQTGLQAQITLENWRNAIYQIPTARAGWRLEKIECQPSSCVVTWQRDFGSYADFHTAVPEAAANSSEAQTGDSPAKASITQTINIVTPAEQNKGLDRRGLPVLREALQQVASQLQDISLVPDVSVSLKQPALYPSTGASTDQINHPVVKGDWSISHDLWTLGDLHFESPLLVLQKLSIQQDAKTQNWSYTLTGNYYAKGKSY